MAYITNNDIENEFMPEIWANIKEYAIPDGWGSVRGDLLVHKIARRVASFNLTQEDEYNIVQGATLAMTRPGEDATRALELEKKGPTGGVLQHLIEMGKTFYAMTRGWNQHMLDHLAGERACVWHMRNSNGETAELLLAKHGQKSCLIDGLLYPRDPWMVEMKFKDKHGKSAVDYQPTIADGLEYLEEHGDIETAETFRKYLDTMMEYSGTRSVHSMLTSQYVQQYVQQCERENVLGIMDIEN